MVLGFLGMLFGNLIKAAVSRQREFLADASAVQFTRNPEGIAGALKRIGAAVFGSKLIGPRAAEASHMYFAEGVASLFATHPPLNVRIRRIDPRWDGKFPPALPTDAVVGVEAEGAEGFIEGVTRAAAADVYDKPVPVPTVQHAARQVASPTEVHRTYVQQLLAAMPQPLIDAAHEPYGARALIFALLLDDNADVRAAQLAALQKTAEPNVFELTLAAGDSRRPVGRSRPVAAGRYGAARAAGVERVAVQRVHQVLPCSWSRPISGSACSSGRCITFCCGTCGRSSSRASRRRSFTTVCSSWASSVRCLLSALARASQQDDDAAFEAGARQIPEAKLQLLPQEACGLNALDQALRDLAQVAPKQRARLVGRLCRRASVPMRRST